MGRNCVFLTCRGNVRRIPSKSCWVSRWFFVMSAFSCKPNTCQSPKTVVNQTKDSLRNLLKHCTQRVNKQGWQTLQRFKWMAFLVRTYLGVWGQRKTPDILQVTVIRTLRSDLNIKRELIWCKGRKQWFMVSSKGQLQVSYLFRNTVSCHFHLTNILLADLLPNKLLESCVIFFFKRRPEKPLFLQASNKRTNCVSVFIDDCPHVLSWRKFNRKTGRHKETNKT